MQRARALACVFFCAVGLACTGGQSGTETPKLIPDAGYPDASEVTMLAAPTACACTLADLGSSLLRVELIAIDDCRVRARVVQTLASSAEPPVALAADQELEADRARGAHCGDGPELRAGDDALLVYLPPQAGDVGTQATALVATWGDQHVFGELDGEAIVLPEAERERVLHTAECGAWFDEHMPRDAAAADMPIDSSGMNACDTQ